MEEEAARAESEARRRASAAEAARAEDAALREQVRERLERERAEHELRVRLEAHQRALAAVHTATLAQREQLARLALGDGRRRCSPRAVGAVLVLSLSAVGVVGAIAQAEAARQIAQASAPPEGPPPTLDVRRIATDTARDALAGATSVGPTNVAPPATPVPTRPATSMTRDRSRGREHPGAPQDNLGRMLDGPDLVTEAGRIDDAARLARPHRRR